MKKSIYILLALLLCTCLPVQAYEYFTIHFKDGTTSEAFYATDVESISYSKQDLDGMEHADWQVQEIQTIDSLYRIPLAAIAYLDFKDVDEDVVAGNVTNVIEQADQLLFDKTPDAIETIVPQLSMIDGVEDVFFDNRCLSLKITDWGRIMYYYPPEENITTNTEWLNSTMNYVTVTTRAMSNQQSTIKACIANQQAKDQSREFFSEIADNVSSALLAIGINTTSIPMPKPEFFSNDIFDYDIAFIKTHGCYDKTDGLHWLLTGQEVLVRNKNGADYNRDWLKQVIQMENFSPRKICLTSVDEVRNGDSVKVFYIAISQEFIRSGVKKGERKTIIFNTACQSVMGPDWFNEKENNPDYSLAQAYVSRGAGCYLGYDDTNTIGADAGEMFLFGLMNGMLVKNSYGEVENIYSYCFHQDNYEYYENGKLCIDHNKRDGVTYKDEYHPTLRCYPNNSLLRINYPQTLEAETITENSQQVKLHGSMKYIESWEAKGFSYSRNCDDCHVFGFYVADNPDMNNYEVYKGIGCYDNSTHTYSFETSLNVNANTTYYYCAAMNDGYSECNGEVMSFGGEAYCVLKDSTLTFYYDYNKQNREGRVYNYGTINRRDRVNKVVFDKSFSNYRPVSTGGLFGNYQHLKIIENIQYLNTSNVTDMRGMFEHCESLTSLDLSNFNTSNVTNMSYMFYDCHCLMSLDLSSFDTSNVTNMNRMFRGCSSLTSLDFRSFDTSNVTNMDFMFCYCDSLESIDVSNMVLVGQTGTHLFKDLKSLKSINLSNANTTQATDMKGMFSGCSSLTSVDLSSFNTSKVFHFIEMFEDCKSLTSLDLSNFNTCNVTNMGRMFVGCSSLRTIYAGNWNCYGYETFDGCISLVGGKGTKIGQNLYGYDNEGKPLYYYCSNDGCAAHIDGGKDNPGLFTAK